MSRNTYKSCGCCGTSIVALDNIKYCKSCRQHLQLYQREIYYLRKRVLGLGGKFNASEKRLVEV